MNQQDQCTDCVKPILCSECEVFMDGNSSMVSLPPKDGFLHLKSGIQFKTCNKCQMSLPLDDFHKSSRNVDGRQHTCKMCKSIVDKKRRLKTTKAMFQISPQEKRNIERAKQLIGECTRQSQHDVQLKNDKLQESSHDEVERQQKFHDVRVSVLGPKSIDALYSLLDLMEAEERKTLQLKGNDYSGDNRLANFERIGDELNMAPEKVLWIYFKKHTDRLRTYITEGAVSSESVVDSIMDCRNYLALLRLMIEARA